MAQVWPKKKKKKKKRKEGGRGGRKANYACGQEANKLLKL